MQYNIGEVFYTSNGSISSNGAVYSSWFWVIILLLFIGTGFGFYYLYRRRMESIFRQDVNYLNSKNYGLGNLAKYHANKVKKSHYHINT